MLKNFKRGYNIHIESKLNMVKVVAVGGEGLDPWWRTPLREAFSWMTG